MDAFEFVKKFGFGEAKRVLHDSRGCASVRLYDSYEFSTSDLKKIVEAFDWIELCGGIDDAKSLAIVHNDVDLKQAIELVEKCQ